jgi:glutamate-1-semialdehyde 2,1-aminomutase
MYGHMDAKLLPDAFPQFMSRAEGARVWDVDGNEYVDLMCSYGPIILGHRHPRVEAAAKAQAAKGDCQNGPSAVMVELAEAFVDRVAHADWAMFSKNGTDATTQCLTIARAATGHRKVLVASGSYHGSAPWCTPGLAGVTPEDRAHLVYFNYNDVTSLLAAADLAGDDLAGIIVTPIRHDLGVDLELPQLEFARAARRICDSKGAVLIIDEVRCGFRLHTGSSWEPIGILADLSAWSKAIANGYALAAVLGREALMESAASIFSTGSFWFSAVAMAASLATLRVLVEEDTLGTLLKTGNAIRNGMLEQAESYGLEAHLSGPVQMPFLSFAGDEDFRLANLFATVALERGVWLHPRHNWFLSGAIGEPEVQAVLEATDHAFAMVAQAAT